MLISLSYTSYLVAAGWLLSPNPSKNPYRLLEETSLSQAFSSIQSKETFTQAFCAVDHDSSYSTSYGFLQKMATVLAKVGILYVAAPAGVVYFSARLVYERVCIRYSEGMEKEIHQENLTTSLDCLQDDLVLTGRAYKPLLQYLMIGVLQKLEGSSRCLTLILKVASWFLRFRIYQSIQSTAAGLPLSLNQIESCLFFTPCKEETSWRMQQALHLFVDYAWVNSRGGVFQYNLKEEDPMNMFWTQNEAVLEPFIVTELMRQWTTFFMSLNVKIQRILSDEERNELFFNSTTRELQQIIDGCCHEIQNQTNQEFSRLTRLTQTLFPPFNRSKEKICRLKASLNNVYFPVLQSTHLEEGGLLEAKRE